MKQTGSTTPEPSSQHASDMARFVAALSEEWRDYRAVILFFCFYMVLANAVTLSVKGELVGFPYQVEELSFRLFIRVPVMLALIAAVLSLWGVVQGWLLPRKSDYASALHAAWAPVRPAVVQPGRTVLRIIVFFLLVAMLMNAFLQIKALIPELVPFQWDHTLSAWDRALHGGVDPWRITWGWFPSLSSAHVIDKLYFSWYVIIHSLPIAVLVFETNRARRTQYLMAYFLLWAVLGNGVALAFSSVGPCFAHLMPDLAETLGATYAPLMTNLASANAQEPLIALGLQNLLWQSFTDPTQTSLGISAMPSLHVAQAVLAACLAFRFSRLLGGLAVLYACLIELGSVHLAWHYAVDGYVAAIGTVILWWGIGKAMDLGRNTRSARTNV